MSTQCLATNIEQAGVEITLYIRTIEVPDSNIE
jgi:hypothetical protein